MFPLLRYNLFQQYSKKPADPITLHAGNRWVHTNGYCCIELLRTAKKNMCVALTTHSFVNNFLSMLADIVIT